MVWASATEPVLAHEDIEIQIKAVTARIAESPRDATLFHRRGDLRRIHEEWDAALADFERALELDPKLAPAMTGKAAVLLATARADEALPLATRATHLAPDDTHAHLVEARVLAALDQTEKADAAYARALSTLDQPTAEVFLERAEQLRRRGRTFFPRAVDVLQDGIERIGPVVTLAEPLIDLQIASGLPDEALATCDRVLKASGPNPRWLLRRGDLLLLVGKPDEAASTYLSVLDRIAALPERRRRTAAIMELEKSANTGLERAKTGRGDDAK